MTWLALVHASVFGACAVLMFSIGHPVLAAYETAIAIFQFGMLVLLAMRDEARR